MWNDFCGAIDTVLFVWLDILNTIGPTHFFPTQAFFFPIVAALFTIVFSSDFYFIY